MSLRMRLGWLYKSGLLLTSADSEHATLDLNSIGSKSPHMLKHCCSCNFHIPQVDKVSQDTFQPSYSKCSRSSYSSQASNLWLLLPVLTWLAVPHLRCSLFYNESHPKEVITFVTFHHIFSYTWSCSDCTGFHWFKNSPFNSLLCQFAYSLLRLAPIT